ncbi:hypothetical protein [Desulfovibrio sp. JC010]|uniref:hypothetical protein n=1 Tax=Desulfovibrio sp. JC010 TaxID=2593641 RepID=UPI0013D242B2|nr:hypothetical protein [Desulfovibrio sp. JC010]NDV28144.1 hypothetical protein [Desulfovibrio sp. JC010]
MIEDFHCTHSSFRENILEHMLIGEVTRTLWKRGYPATEVMRTEVDAMGYDIVFSVNGYTRFVQLKARKAGARGTSLSVNRSLENKHGGCVIVILCDEVDLALKGFRWFGNRPDEKMTELPDKVAKRPTANSQGVKPELKSKCLMNWGLFQPIADVEELVDVMFPDLVLT